MHGVNKGGGGRFITPYVRARPGVDPPNPWGEQAPRIKRNRGETMENKHSRLVAVKWDGQTNVLRLGDNSALGIEKNNREVKPRHLVEFEYHCLLDGPPDPPVECRNFADFILLCGPYWTLIVSLFQMSAKQGQQTKKHMIFTVINQTQRIFNEILVNNFGSEMSISWEYL
jgi:hypothetical protein